MYDFSRFTGDEMKMEQPISLLLSRKIRRFVVCANFNHAPFIDFGRRRVNLYERVPRAGDAGNFRNNFVLITGLIDTGIFVDCTE